MSQRRSNPMLYRLIPQNDGEYDPGHSTLPQRADRGRRISKTSNFKKGEAIIKKDVEEGKITNEEAHTL
ncbi:unnamed protein product [Caenorhabditis brenneri]